MADEQSRPLNVDLEQRRDAAATVPETAGDVAGAVPKGLARTSLLGGASVGEVVERFQRVRGLGSLVVRVGWWWGGRFWTPQGS